MGKEEGIMMSPIFNAPLTTNDLSLNRLLAVRLPIMLIFIDQNDHSDVQQELRELAEKFAGQLLIAKISVKENPESTHRYQIQQAPAVIGVKDGEVIAKGEGISASVLPNYARFLTGKGPKPNHQPDTARGSTGFASQSNGNDPYRKTAVGKPIPVSDYSFDKEVMHSSIPVLVDFWAPWCGPCRMTEPILEKLASELHGKLTIVKVNVDESPQLSNRYGIQSIPTMMLLKNGNVIDRWMGALPETALRSRLSRIVNLD
jgi:thioredoxin 1